MFKKKDMLKKKIFIDTLKGKKQNVRIEDIEDIKKYGGKSKSRKINKRRSNKRKRSNKRRSSNKHKSHKHKSHKKIHHYKKNKNLSEKVIHMENLENLMKIEDLETANKLQTLAKLEHAHPKKFILV